MGSKTVYTSTITVPVYAAWKCEKCGQANFSDGKIRYQVETSSGSMFQSKHDEAKAAAQQNAQSGWADHALSIMMFPNESAEALRSSLFLENTKCTHCGKKPKWDNKEKKILSILCLLSLFSAILIFAAIVMSGEAGLTEWLITLALAAVGCCGFIDGRLFKKTMENLPKEYTPVIGSLNQELIERAAKRHRQIPSPEQAFEIVKKY